MSDQNAELVQRFYTAASQGATAGSGSELFADDVVLENPVPDSLPFGGTYQGPRAVARYMGQISESLEFLAFEITEIIAQGDKVVALGSERSRVNHSADAPLHLRSYATSRGHARYRQELCCARQSLGRGDEVSE